MMSQIAVITVKVVTEAPVLGQGDNTEAKPKPDPRASRITDNARSGRRGPGDEAGSKLSPVAAYQILGRDITQADETQAAYIIRIGDMPRLRLSRA
jgi:hypothetical protein